MLLEVIYLIDHNFSSIVALWSIVEQLKEGIRTPLRVGQGNDPVKRTGVGQKVSIGSHFQDVHTKILAVAAAGALGYQVVWKFDCGHYFETIKWSGWGSIRTVCFEEQEESRSCWGDAYQDRHSRLYR